MKLSYQEFLNRCDLLVRRSHTTPYRQVSYVLSLVYAACVLLYAGIARLFSKTEPSRLDRAFAEVYDHVPEMAVYKAIAYRPFLTEPLSGRGLDLGCGNGLAGGILIRAAGLSDLHGLDLKPHRSPLKYGYKSFTTGDLAALPTPENPFDYVLSVGVLEHVPDLDSVLSNTARQMKPGARLLFTFPTKNWIHATAASRIYSAFGMTAKAQAYEEARQTWSTHFHYLNADDLQATLAGHGFADIDIRPIFHRDALFAYDLLNIQTYLMSFYVPDRLEKILERRPFLRRAMRKATEKLCAYYAGKMATPETATLNFVTCRKV